MRATTYCNWRGFEADSGPSNSIVDEVTVAGDLAYSRSRLEVTITSRHEQCWRKQQRGLALRACPQIYDFAPSRKAGDRPAGPVTLANTAAIRSMSATCRGKI